MPANLRFKEYNIQFIENFLCAGSSALLISVAHFYPEFWFVSLFALVPFLWRVTKVSLSGSIVPGIILASCYAFVAYPDEILIAPRMFLFKFFCLNLIFTIFGIAVNRIRRYIGFNPVLIAVLWLPLEYTLKHYAHLGSIFAFSETDSMILIRIGSLFGMLMVFFVVVLINALILIILRRVVQALCSRTTFLTKDDKRPYRPSKKIILERGSYYLPRRRAPPSQVTTMSWDMVGSARHTELTFSRF